MIIRTNSPSVALFLRRAIQPAEMGADAVIKRLRDGSLQGWAIFVNDELKGVMATELVEYPSPAQALRVTLMAGVNLESWKEAAMTALLEEAGRLGCSWIEAVGRKGLVKALEPLGFKFKYVVLVKEVQ